MKLIDANLIIRYLTIDDHKKALTVKRLLERSQEELGIYSYDRDIDKVKTIKRLEP